eukprot:712720_1
MVIPVKKQRLSNKTKSWYRPQAIERIIILLQTDIPISSLYPKARLLDEWRFSGVSDEIYNNIAAPKPSTARKQVFECNYHVKYGFSPFLSNATIPKAFITDKGSVLCRQKEPIKAHCFTFTLNTNIPTEFIKKDVTQFACIYKSTISKVIKDSD